MGVQIWGAFGGFQKKTGALVGAWLKGQNVIKAIPHKSQVPATPAQINQRFKFGLIVSWLSNIKPLINIGFKDAHTVKQSPMNAAVAYNYKNAIAGIAPAFVIDYAKVVLSKGKLSEPYLPSVTSGIAAVKFDWDAAIMSTGIGSATDKATFVVYNPIQDRFAYLNGVIARSAQEYDMSLPATFSGELVHCYMAFVSADGKMVSNSIYIGSVTIL